MARTVCISAGDAVHRLLKAGMGATAICWSRSERFDIRLGTSTPFGPVVRRWEDEDEAFLHRLISDTERASPAPLYVAGPVSEDLDGVFSRLQRSSSAVPVRNVGGRRTAMWWCSSHLGERPFNVGDRLRPTIEFFGGHWDVSYRAEDGRFAGLHARLAHEPGRRQRQIVEESRARVERMAYGTEVGAAGEEIRTQLLVLSIPHELATAFPDGKLPRVRNMMALEQS